MADLLELLYESFAIKDVIDIAIVALFIFVIYVFIRQTKSYFIFNSFLFLLGIVYLSQRLDLTLTKELFQPLLTFFIVIFVVVFQREIRHFFDWFSISSRHLSTFRKISLSSEVSNVLVDAAKRMAEERIGGIIVIAGEYPIDGFVEGGYTIDGRVSESLLLSIFDTGSPGHDGAVLIQNNRIRKFGLHLPLAEQYEHFDRHGTRHRAAVGITEKTDALAIVISEEKGIISLAQNGTLNQVRDVEHLEDTIKAFLTESVVEARLLLRKEVVLRHLFALIASVLIAVFLWQFFTE